MRTRCARAADEVHLDAAERLVVERAMAKRGEVEVAAELAVDARQEIEVERGGDAERIVVRRLEDVAALAQIGAEEQRVAGGERGAEVA
jgi:hypothetical protein